MKISFPKQVSKKVPGQFRGHFKLFIVFTASIIFASCASLGAHPDQEDEHHHHEDQGRLLVHTTDGSIIIMDVTDGDVLAEFRSIMDPGLASVRVNSSGEFGFVSHRETWLTAVVDSGYHLEDHGDHHDLHREDPAMLGTVRTGASPSHYASALGNSIIYNDDDGTIALFDEGKLRDSLEFSTISARIGHGAPVITGDALVVGYQNTPEIDVLGYDGTVKQILPSGTRLHGQARMGRFIAFGAVEGIVLLTWDGSRYAHTMLPYPEGFPEGGRVGHLRSHILVPHFIGRAESYLIKIDPADERLSIHPMPVPFRQFEFDGTGRYLVILGDDGVLHSVDPETLQIKGSVQVVEKGISGGGIPAPSLTMGRRHAWVSDPGAGKIVMIDLRDMDIEAEMAVPGPGHIGGMVHMQTEGVVH